MHSTPVITAQARVRYLQRRAQDLGRAREAQAQGDWLEVAEIGHRIKGSGETFGYPELTQIGDDLEAGAMAAQASATGAVLSRLESWIREVSPGGIDKDSASSSLSLR